ncbi:MAG: hypothetical protein M3405_04105 [Acidobacteriota bacterium]|nr:hypothetical protein [Acidobacteriota bacterium]
MSVKSKQIKIAIDADIYNFLESESKQNKDSSIEKVLNEILREKLEIETKKVERYKKFRNEILNDIEFLQELKEKLAA